MPLSLQKIINPVREYYTQKVLLHGSSSWGADWKTRESQELRFQQLLKITGSQKNFSILDWGCGYGYLFEYMKKNKYSFVYKGFDLSAEMIRMAQKTYGKPSNARFQVGSPSRTAADFVVGSGIFNVKLGVPHQPWKNYVLKIIGNMNRFSRRGFSFNVLTKYSDKKRMRPDLYYADPLFLFDYCKRRFSKDVALLHDYGLYEFTILVRKKI